MLQTVWPELITSILRHQLVGCTAKV